MELLRKLGLAEGIRENGKKTTATAGLRNADYLINQVYLPLRLTTFT